MTTDNEKILEGLASVIDGLGREKAIKRLEKISMNMYVLIHNMKSKYEKKAYMSAIRYINLQIQDLK
jgi:hypothetical protein